jgi:hypothetical protein
MEGWVWWCIPTIPVTWKAETEISHLKARLGKKLKRPYLKTKLGVVTYNFSYAGVRSRTPLSEMTPETASILINFTIML